MPEPDLALLRIMRTRGHHAAVERAAGLLAKSGENGAVWFGIGLTGAAIDRPRRRAWLTGAVIGPAAIVLNFAIKLVVRRQRPVLEGLPPLGGAPSSLSFPSAHSTASFAAAVAMSRIEPRARAALFGLAALIALTRPYLGMHYPSDVVVGAALGVTIGVAIPLPEQQP